MQKCLKRLLQLQVITCIFYIMFLIAIIKLLIPSHGEYNYEHIPEDKIKTQLYWKLNVNFVKKPKVDCKYDEILTSAKTFNSSEVPTKYDDFSPKGIANGSFAPEHCNPTFSVAILVTYRNRQQQWDIFLPYMHNFLRQQNIHYKIFLIEQQDDKTWNKGLLYNIGAHIAIAEKFPCLILHDVDLLPLDRSNLYVCTISPRHMSASIDKFRYVLPYPSLSGGVLAIRADQYVTVDGFSNRFQGWGGEDDDFASRLDSEGFQIVRFPQRMSRYTMLRHKPQQRNEERFRILVENLYHRSAGYAAASYRSLHLSQQRLYTHLAVHL